MAHPQAAQSYNHTATTTTPTTTPTTTTTTTATPSTPTTTTTTAHTAAATNRLLLIFVLVLLLIFFILLLLVIFFLLLFRFFFIFLCFLGRWRCASRSKQILQTVLTSESKAVAACERSSSSSGTENFHGENGFFLLRPYFSVRRRRTWVGTVHP